MLEASVFDKGIMFNQSIFGKVANQKNVSLKSLFNQNISIWINSIDDSSIEYIDDNIVFN